MENKEIHQEALVITTSQEGHEMAIIHACKSVVNNRSDSKIRKRLNSDYTQNPALLIASTRVRAIELQENANADYLWRS